MEYPAQRVRDIKKYGMNLSLNLIVLILVDQKLILGFSNIETKYSFLYYIYFKLFFINFNKTILKHHYNEKLKKNIPSTHT